MRATPLPEIIRHNSCFLISRGTGDKGWLFPTKPSIGNCGYHDMVADTIYLRSSHDLDKARRYLQAKPARDEDLAGWSQARFRSQRESAEIWDELRATFGPNEDRSTWGKHIVLPSNWQVPLTPMPPPSTGSMGGRAGLPPSTPAAAQDLGAWQPERRLGTGTRAQPDWLLGTGMGPVDGVPRSSGGQRTAGMVPEACDPARFLLARSASAPGLMLAEANEPNPRRRRLGYVRAVAPGVVPGTGDRSVTIAGLSRRLAVAAAQRERL